MFLYKYPHLQHPSYWGDIHVYAQHFDVWHFVIQNRWIVCLRSLSVSLSLSLSFFLSLSLSLSLALSLNSEYYGFMWHKIYKIKVEIAIVFNFRGHATINFNYISRFMRFGYSAYQPKSQIFKHGTLPSPYAVTSPDLSWKKINCWEQYQL